MSEKQILRRQIRQLGLVLLVLCGTTAALSAISSGAGCSGSGGGSGGSTTTTGTGGSTTTTTTMETGGSTTTGSCANKCQSCSATTKCCSGYTCNSNSMCAANTDPSTESAMLVFFGGANNCANPATGVTIKLTNIDCCVVKTATLTASGMSPMNVPIAGMSACPEIYFDAPSTPGTYTVAVIDGMGNSIPAGTITIPCP